MIESLKTREDYLRREHWLNLGTKKAIAQSLGSKILDWELWRPGDICSEFLGIANRYKLQNPDKISPSEIIEPEQFKDYFQKLDGQFELHNSLWQRESHENANYPCRSLLVWDIELFDQNNPLSPIDTPEDTLYKLEVIHELFKQKLNEYNIDFLTVVSGRGYNYETSVSYETGALDALLEISGDIESTVLDKQKYPNPNIKRRKQVPVFAERLHVASVRLQQYLFNEIIKEARQRQPLAVEVSDKGEYGIAFDNTAMLYTAENRSIGALATPYFIKLEKNDPDYVKTVIKILRSNGAFDLSKEEVQAIRSNYKKANELFLDVDCRIPDAHMGIIKLIEDYKKSKLYGFHKIMDSSFGDHPDDYTHGYRNYDYIANNTNDPERIKYLIFNANDELLKPDNLDYFIWEIFRSWGGDMGKLELAPHVAGFLRSIYEDPRFEWGTRFIKADAQRFARGWVTTIIGQVFEKSFIDTTD